MHSRSIGEEIRIFIYDWVVAHGEPPCTPDIGAHVGLTENEARTAIAGLNIGKAVLCHPITGEVWMAGPFAASETPYRVIGSRASWWANCAWDMLGIAAIVGQDVTIEASCADCAEPMRMSVKGGGVQGNGLIHLLLPVRDWYRDIAYT
ncbi:MAG: organomercurial lyase [Gemmatimonadaceae bacterium]